MDMYHVSHLLETLPYTTSGSGSEFSLHTKHVIVECVFACYRTHSTQNKEVTIMQLKHIDILTLRQYINVRYKEIKQSFLNFIHSVCKYLSGCLD